MSTDADAIDVLERLREYDPQLVDDDPRGLFARDAHLWFLGIRGRR